MADLTSCPQCGLSQSALHAFCARCDFPFDGSAPEQPAADALVGGNVDIATGDAPLPNLDHTPTGNTPSGRTSTDTPTGHTPSGRTPTGGTPSGRTPATDPPDPPPPAARSLAPTDAVPLAKKRDPLSVTDVSEDNNPEGLPRGPSWNLPGRPEETGGSWSKEGGLPRAAVSSRGSLTARQRAAKAAASVDGAGPPLTDESVPAVGHTVRSSAPGAAAGSNPGRSISQPGSRQGELRGRPPGKLYASENSIPPGDPLMAALVSGEALVADSFPDIALTGPPDDSGGHIPVFDELPPVQEDDDAAAVTLPDPDLHDPNRPRVVPPSMGRRPTTGGRRRRTGSGVSVPGHPVPSRPEVGAPSDPTMGAITSDPRVGSVPGMRRQPPPGQDPRSASLPPAPRAASTPAARARALPPDTRGGRRPPDTRGGQRAPNPRGASIPGDFVQRPLGSGGSFPPPSLDGVPLPPPVRIPDAPHVGTDPQKVRLGIRVTLAVVAMLLAMLAVRDISGMVGDLAGLRAAVNENIRSDGLPTPDLPQVLDHRINELDLKKRIVGRWATISAKADQFSVGVEVEHKIVGVPRRTRVSRDGRFAVVDQLKTLEFYLADWELDAEGHALLEDDRRRRERR